MPTKRGAIHIEDKLASREFDREIRAKLNAGEDMTFEQYKEWLIDKLRSEGDEYLWQIMELICKFRAPLESETYCSAEVLNKTQVYYYSIASGRPDDSLRVFRIIHGGKLIILNMLSIVQMRQKYGYFAGIPEL